MRSAVALAVILCLGALAGCTTPVPPVPGAAPPPATIVPVGDPRLPATMPALRAGDVPQFPIFDNRATNMTRGGSARETSLAISPLNPAIAFACDPSGVPNVSGGHSFYYLSKDNGTTWQDLQIETEATDPRKATFEGGDCDVAIDDSGALYSADTWLGNLAVGSSKDGGAHWTTSTPAAGTSPVIDRPWIIGGPAGTVYLTYQDVQFGMPSLIWFTKSTDYGQTFMPAVPVATATQDGAFTWTGNFAVSHDGRDLYSVYTRRASGVVATPAAKDGESVWVAASHDSGLTWTSHKVSESTQSASYLYPSLAMDAGGQLHVVYSQAREADQPIWYSTSKDQAQTWSPPLALTNGTAGYSPWIAAGKAGQAIAIWEGSPNPQATFDADSDWYLYWAHVENGTVQAGTTTAQPIFHGKQSVGFAEFDMVRLDKNGVAHIGASIPQGKSNNVHWQAVYQRQLLGPTT